jgi:hypothetical protein
MRVLAIGAFILDGIASVGFIGMMALGEGRMTPLDGLILAGLLLGFFSAFGSVVLSEPSHVDEAATLILSGAAMFDRLPDAMKRDLRRHFPPTSPAHIMADPAQHLAILSQPSIEASAAP